LSEDFVSNPAANEAAEDPAAALSGAHQAAAAHAGAKQATKHAAEPALLRLGYRLRLGDGKSLGLHPIGDVRDECTGAALDRRFVNSQLLCDRASPAGPIEQ
jgi:hypothetical protein